MERWRKGYRYGPNLLLGQLRIRREERAKRREGDASRHFESFKMNITSQGSVMGCSFEAESLPDFDEFDSYSVVDGYLQES